MSGPPTYSVADRRRHSRFPLGLPVHLHLAGRTEPLTVELMDISAGGGRFRAQEDQDDDVRLHQHAAFGFVVPGQRRCAANGRVVRVSRGGVFVVSLDHANDDFRGFISALALG